MHCRKTLIFAAWLSASLASAATFNGDEALQYTRRAVAFGQRPAGSAQNRKLQDWIVAQLRTLGCQVSFDEFMATTPVGSVPMRNIIAKFPGTSGRAIAIAGHFDSKPIAGITFLGANDGGSSTGFLLELAHTLNNTPHTDDLYLIWFDGEEAFVSWTATDSRYGSRHLASKWASDGTLARFKALINVDMTGDKDLDILQDSNSSPALMNLFWQMAGTLGYGQYFLNAGEPMDDDHIPFVQQGVNTLELIDFDFGPNNSYWHTAADTMDKVSAHSLQVVGSVMLPFLDTLQQQ